MRQAVKGASPNSKTITPLYDSDLEENTSGIHTRAQLPILMHIEKNRMGIGFANDKNN
jgi:hypothetical protein